MTSDAKRIYTKLSVSDAADMILNAKSALIVSHSYPDGDAVGSAIAIKKIFELLGKKAKSVFPTAIPDYVAFLAEAEDCVYAEKEEENYDIIITSDVASVSQLGSLGFLAEKVRLMIDHHSSGTPFADNITDPHAAAAGEIVYKIYTELVLRKAIPHSADVCRFLFSAVTADTGSFKYSNTTPTTFRIAASLAEEISGSDDGGLGTDDLSRLIHDTVTEKDMAIYAAVTKKVKLFESGALAAVIITEKDMKKGGFDEKDLGGAVDIIRKIRGVLVSVVVKQKNGSENEYKISSRASADIDVSEICASFGGGGHVRAAGATLKAASPEEAFGIAVAAFSAAVREYKTSGK